MSIFVSHISEEALEARALKLALERALPGARVFVSAASIHLGDPWLKEIRGALASAKAIVTLCSPDSVRRPWLNFESGGGWSKDLRVVPVCYKGMRKDHLPDPMGIFQAAELTSADSCRQLVTQIAGLLDIAQAPNFDPEEMLRSLKIERPARTQDIGIVLCHDQDKWDDGARSVFALGSSVPTGLDGDWSFRAIDDEQDFLTPNLHELSGMILGNPWRKRMLPDTVDAVVQWVGAGGRLLLLGFELGDRHHDGNLAELSHHFGIYPVADIVGAPKHGKLKPYDTPVDFDSDKGDAHPLTSGLEAIRLSNVQTVRVDPGGVEWLRVGQNVVYRPTRDSVRYRDGTMTTPGGAVFDMNKNAGWLPVAVEAPKGLCGAGSVQMVGTWDLIGRCKSYGGDNLQLLTRLLNWLKGIDP